MVRIIQGLAVAAVCAVLAAVLLVRHERASAAEISPAVRARGLQFDPAVSASDRAWILAAEHAARPEAARLLDEIDGLVVVGTVYEPDLPWVGMADPNTDRVTFNLSYLDGNRKIDREQAVLHELGHVIDFKLLPDDEVSRLASALPSTGMCLPERGDCSAPPERFADTFARWALRGNVSLTGSGYQLASPASLEDWGAPLAALAIELDVRAHQ